MKSYLNRAAIILGLGLAFGATAAVWFGFNPAARAGARSLATAVCAARPSSAIEHLIVIIQENHSFDSYFGTYCQAPVGSHPKCTDGPQCCEMQPMADPGTGKPPVVLTDEENASYDPHHNRGCEEDAMHGGKMDRFVNGRCGDPRNFVVPDPKVMAPYWDFARKGALADRYFQPVIGASSANDMYFARASFVFTDNDVMPASVGSKCVGGPAPRRNYSETTIGDLLLQCNIPWTFYAEGYEAMRQAEKAGHCPQPLAECRSRREGYPCTFDPSDVPFEYYPTTKDNPRTMKDFSTFASAVRQGTLPAVSFIKPLGFRTEHPGGEITISEGEAFVTSVVEQVLGSPAYASNTLVLLAMDESGGFFDHVPPPPTSRIDHQPYGARLPLIAVGRFARAGQVSHVTLEHSSIVKFIEWNWLGAKTGQLGTRDTEVNNIGSLLDPVATVTRVPEH